MSIDKLNFAEPFYCVRYIESEKQYDVNKKSILINLDKQAIQIQDQQLEFLQSVVVTNTIINNIKKAILIDDYDRHRDDKKFLDEVKKTWALAYDVRKEERLKGVSHYMSPKVTIGNIDLSMYHSGSVPLDVGLHKLHRGGEAIKEVHTQIYGFGKMQQCLENDLDTLYLEELMAPGTTHKPMWDENGNYPWHQYETITPSIFMAFEILP